MKNIIHTLDLFILKLFQNTQDFIEDWTRINCFFIARLIMAVCIGAMLLTLESLFIQGDGLAFCATVIALIIVGPAYFQMINNAEATCLNNPEFGNPLLLQFTVLRPVSWGLLLMYMIINGCRSGLVKRDWVESLFNNSKIIYLVAMILFSYFASCTPHRRKTNKAESLFKKLFYKKALQKV